MYHILNAFTLCRHLLLSFLHTEIVVPLLRSAVNIRICLKMKRIS